MALRNIVQDGDPILKKTSRPVTVFDDKLAQLVEDMKETLVKANGLGLAGPQVGILRRVFIAVDERDIPEDATAEERANYPTKMMEFINPEILEQDGEEKSYEGCLSFPGKYGAIVRPTKVKVRAFNVKGEPFELEAEDLFARCICHETNHLDGITIDDLAEYFYDPDQEHDLDKEL